MLGGCELYFILYVADGNESTEFILIKLHVFSVRLRWSLSE